MPNEPCRTRDTDRMEAFCVLAAIAVVVAWLMFLGGCAATGGAEASYQHAALAEDAALERRIEQLHEARLDRARERGGASEASRSARSIDAFDSIEALDAAGISDFYRYRAPIGLFYDVDHYSWHQKRGVQRDIRRLRSDIHRYSSGGRHSSHRFKHRPFHRHRHRR